MPKEVKETMDEIERKIAMNKEAGRLLTIALENTMGVKKDQFNPRRWFPLDKEQLLLRSRWMMIDYWSTFR
jgi:hypothetical protein